MNQINRRNLLLTGAAGASTLAMPGIVRAAPTTTLKVYSNQQANESSIHYLWFKKFQENLQAAVGGQIKLDLFPNGILGKEGDAILQVKLGSIDMMIMNSGVWSPLVPEISLFDLCYLFDSEDHQARAMDGAAGKLAAKLLQDKTGVTTLAWTYHLSPRNIYTKAPVKTLDDVKGMKLRVFSTRVFIDAFETIGAVPTPVPFNELYTAVQTGVVNGFELDNGSTLQSKLAEVTKNCFVSEHLYMPLCSYIGKVGMSKIPAALQPAFMKAANDATLAHRKEARERKVQVVEALKKEGVVFTPQAADERTKIKQKLATSLWQPFVAKYPNVKPIVEAIDSARS